MVGGKTGSKWELTRLRPCTVPPTTHCGCSPSPLDAAPHSGSVKQCYLMRLGNFAIVLLGVVCEGHIPVVYSYISTTVVKYFDRMYIPTSARLEMKWTTVVSILVLLSKFPMTRPSDFPIFSGFSQDPSRLRSGKTETNPEG